MAKLNKSGETIIEVLISVAVIGATLAGSYYLANRSSQQTRAAVERTEALKAAESKVEILRSNLKNDIALEGSGPYCVLSGSMSTVSDGICKVEPRYNILTTVSTTAGVSTYAFTATWDSILGTQDTLTIYYRP